MIILIINAAVLWAVGIALLIVLKKKIPKKIFFRALRDAIFGNNHQNLIKIFGQNHAFVLFRYLVRSPDGGNQAAPETELTTPPDGLKKILKFLKENWFDIAFLGWFFTNFMQQSIDFVIILLFLNFSWNFCFRTFRSNAPPEPDEQTNLIPDTAWRQEIIN